MVKYKYNILSDDYILFAHAYLMIRWQTSLWHWLVNSQISLLADSEYLTVKFSENFCLVHKSFSAVLSTSRPVCYLPDCELFCQRIIQLP